MRWLISIIAVLGLCRDSVAQQVLSFDSVTNLLSKPNPAAWSQNGKAPLRINGYLSPGDWGSARDGFWVRGTNLVIWGKTNSLSTNRGAFFQMPGATNGYLVIPDCYVGTPEIDPRWFGMPAPELYPDIQVRLTGQRITNDSLPAVQAATDFLSERGGGIIKMPAGMFRWGGSLLLKPDVHIKGAKRTTSVQFDAGPVNVGLSHGLTVIFGSFGNTNYLNANGLGFPLILADGPRFYTNKTTQTFVNFAGDTINYYRGGNTIEDLVLIPEYAWAWNWTNYPSAGFVFNEVANMEIKGCAIYGAFAPGGYIRGCLGYRVFENLIQANWIGGLFVTDCSDGIIQGNRFPNNKGFGVAIYKANSHRLINNEYWNPTFDVVRYTGATTSVTNGNYVSNQLNVRTNFTADPVTDTISVAVGSDTGMPVEIGGTDLPGGLATNTIYFMRSSATVTNGQNYTLYLSSGGALGKNPAATPIDITSAGGTNTWWVQSPTHTAAMVWARACEEIYIHGGRADMPINKGIVFQDLLRGQINAVDQWDMGREAKLENISIPGDDDVVGIHLIDTHGVEVVGNTLNANKYFSGVFPRDYIGLRMQGAVDTTVVGNFFDRMAYGIESDATSTLGPKRSVDVNNFGVGALRSVVSDSLVSTGEFSGVLLKKTNNIAGTIPAAHTNVTEFAVAVKFQLSTNLPNNGQEPIVHLTSSTNLAAPGARTPYSLTAVQYFDGAQQTDFIYLRMFGATTNDWRDWYASVGEMRGKHIEMVFERSTNGTMALYVDGWQRTLSQGTAGAGAATTQALWAPYLVLGGYDIHVRSNWVYGLSYARGTNWSADAINKGKAWATPNPAIVALWTFEGASTNGVWDLSGNGVHGRLNSLATAQAPTWGPDPSYRVQAGTGITVTRVGPLVDEIAAATVIADGDKGDISVSGSGASWNIDADAVDLGTDTTGAYVATVAGTANEVSVSGSGGEAAAVTVSLPSTIDLGGKTSFEVPNGAAPTVDAFGEIAGDNDAWAASRGAIVAYDGTAATRLVGVLSSDTPSAGQVPKFQTGGTITWEDDQTGAGGLSDGDKGDITVASSGASWTIDADAVALATDTTGNYVATVAGTANEVSVAGSGSENAAVTLSLPSTIDLGGKTSFEVPNGAAPTVDAFGEIAGDNDAWAASRGAIVAYDGTAATRLVGVLASDTPSNGQVPKWNTGGTITWEDDSAGGGGISDGDKGDITVASSGASWTIDADAVALATDTTGNFVATVAGTANEVSVSGSGSENAAVTLSLPSTIDLGGKTSFEVPNGAAPTVDAFGEIAGDNDAWAASRGAIVAYDGTAATRLVGVLSSDTPSNGQVPKWNTGGTITWEDDSTGGGGVSDGDKGDITVASSGASWTIDSGAVTYAKMQNVSAASKLLGRGDSGSGAPQEITLGGGLGMTGTTLSVVGTSGGTATPGIVAKSATTVSVVNTTAETELLDYLIPGGTLSANGDEVEIFVPAKYQMYSGQTSAYRWDFYLDYNDTPTATTGNYSGLTYISTTYAQFWRVRLKRISSTTCSIIAEHVLGSDDQTDKVNAITQVRYLNDYTLTGSKTFDDDFNIGLTITLGESSTSHRCDTFGYTIAKIGAGGSGAHMQVAHFTALDNQPPASSYATFATRNSFAVLEFDASTEESARGVAVIPEGADISGGLKFKITWTTAATSGDGRWGVQVMRLNTDIDSDSFDTAAEATTTCNGTSGVPATTTITLTDLDGLTAGEPFAFKIYRDTSDSADTINSNDLQMMVADITTVN